MVVMTVSKLAVAVAAAAAETNIMISTTTTTTTMMMTTSMMMIMALDVGAGAGVSTEVLYNLGYHTIECVIVIILPLWRQNWGCHRCCHHRHRIRILRPPLELQ